LGFTYDESILPNTSVSSRDVSRIWAEQLKKVVPDVDLVVTGEPYGDYLAEFMQIKHIRVQRDGDRSATAIRSDIMKNWEMLNSNCRKDLVRKITIAGTESTGKSTLVQRLALHFGTTYVTETGRAVVGNTNTCTLNDLSTIAKAHYQDVEAAMTRARRLLFLDTDIYTTASYSKFLFQRDLEISAYTPEASRVDLTLYLDSDAPYVQDGTRLSKPDRDALDKSHRAILERENIPYTVLKGSYDDRFAAAVAAVEAIIPFDSTYLGARG
jgi:HTH-type transcriptional repressor of NAD biosynthesis genes